MGIFNMGVLYQNENDRRYTIEEKSFDSIQNGIPITTKYYQIWYNNYEDDEDDWKRIDDDFGYPNIPLNGKWRNHDDAVDWINDNSNEITIWDLA